MGSNAVKSIVLLMVIVVLSFIVGAQVSDSMKDSMGAFAIIGCTTLLFVMLWLGSSAWKLIYLLPSVLILLNFNVLGVPLDTLVGVFMLFYWLVMRMMGYVRFTWYAHGMLDVLVAVMTLYVIVSYYRHPVVMRVFEADYDYIGGKEYIYAFFATLYYVSLSSIYVKYDELMKVLKQAFWLGVIVSLYTAFRGIMNPESVYAAGKEGMDVGDLAMHGRFSFFAGLSSMLFFLLYSRNSLGQILLAPKKFFLAAACISGILISGWRTTMAIFSLNVAVFAVIRREICSLIIFAVFACGGIFMVGQSGAFLNAPNGMQRVLSVFPGVIVSDAVVTDTTMSTKVRKEAWWYALDPSTGAIKDYIWGDGFQQSRSEFDREQIAGIRGVRGGGGNPLLKSALWHNGCITYLHRLGIVGMVLAHMVMLVAFGMMCRIGRALIGTKEAIYVLQPMLALVPVALMSWYLVWIVTDIFRIYTSIVLIKIIYVMLLRQGRIRPFLSQQAYVPLMIRQLEAKRS